MDLVSLLILALVFGLIFYGIQSLLPLAPPFKNVALLILILIFVVYLLGGLHLGGHLLWRRP